MRKIVCPYCKKVVVSGFSLLIYTIFSNVVYCCSNSEHSFTYVQFLSDCNFELVHKNIRVGNKVGKNNCHAISIFNKIRFSSDWPWSFGSEIIYHSDMEPFNYSQSYDIIKKYKKLAAFL